ncbi:E3 ubiquitin-protein ligase ATL41-like [Durio zibethinus]|uniref:RING-type E3 ubiquitin transferase n=1 Tax=Durio zibethinus TaxID=66656 RepID=A0A6P5X650_DURZI|nr:E3 ubiquitin-protein ligase ATL41-like [Durio zibethinus]
MGPKDDDVRKFGFSRTIMVAAIASLLGVVMLMILLHLYGRYLLRREERRRRAALYSLRTQIETIGGSSINEAPMSGLDPLVIASLPKFTYNLTTSEVDHYEPTECSVCLGTITEESMVRLLPNCKHIFHVECIDSWLGSNTTCPICRTVAEPTFQAPEDKGLGSRVHPTAPPIEENASDSAAQMEKEGGPSGSGSRFASFRRMLGKERSSSRSHSQDLESQ